MNYLNKIPLLRIADFKLRISPEKSGLPHNSQFCQSAIRNYVHSSLFTFLLTSFSFAQSISDSTYHLKEITIISNRLQHFSAGTKINTVDSLSLMQHSNQNLADLLMDESPLFIKSYGLGSLATSTFRGGNANHTAVLWNGFNINSPMNGQLDLSLVPVNFADDITIQYGGTSALWGSGAVGGAILMNNTAKFNNGITSKVNLSAGSFGTYSQQATVEVSKQRFVSSIKIFNTTAKNNFTYTNIFSSDKNKVIQSNAELKSYGLLSENYFLLKDNQKINLFFWGQHTDRNIPPTMLQMLNNSNQIDNDYRITSEWKRDGKKISSSIRAAYFNEALTYSVPSLFLAVNRSQSFITEAETRINLSTQHFINLGINNTFVTAVAPNYQKEPHQNRTALFASYRYTNKNEKLNTTLSAREEIVGTQNFVSLLIPFTYSAGADYQLMKWLGLKSNISKVYRLPTLNDLYWNPGGNPNLLPESGYSEEVGLKLDVKTEDRRQKTEDARTSSVIGDLETGETRMNLFSLSFSTEATVFNRNINNWIIWLPSMDYWSPQNIMTVWSRGMESNSTITVHLNKVKIKFSVLTNYVVSTNQQAKTINDNSFDKQLIYVPMYSGHGKMTIEYKNILLSCNESYTGYRYTATDNSEYLKPYILTNIYVAYKISFRQYRLNLFAQINNLFDEQYQVLLNRAMPLRNYQAGISIQFNNLPHPQPLSKGEGSAPN